MLLRTEVRPKGVELNSMTENTRSVLVGAAAWVLILAGGCSSVVAVYHGFVLASMFSSPGFMLGLAGATLPVEMPPLARLAVEHVGMFFVFNFLVWLDIFITGLGLLARKAWALAAFRWLFYIGAGCFLGLLLFPGFVVPGPYMHDGVAPAPEFNAAVTALRFKLRLIALLLGTGAFWLARRFERPDVRSEFGVN